MAATVAAVNKDPQYLFNLVRRQLPQVRGFGYVYILTIQFLITGGKFPIYDKFAHVAALAIDQGLMPASPPASFLKYSQLATWGSYQAYMNLLASIRSACPHPQNSPMFISRDLDRALWVYGHFFETNLSAISTGTR